MTRRRRYPPTRQTLSISRPGGEQPLCAADPPSAETGKRPGRSEAATPISPVYTLGTNPAEQNRLRRQSDDLHPHTLTMLARTGLQPGAATLALGCGPRGTIELLSQRVGPTGQVTGMDVNPVHVDLARQLVREEGLGNVDAALHLCYPSHPAWDRLTEVFHAAYRSDGADLFIGRKLAAMLRDAGVTDVGTEAASRGLSRRPLPAHHPPRPRPGHAGHDHRTRHRRRRRTGKSGHAGER